MKPDTQNIELRSTPKGLTAWCNGLFLGFADVVGTEVTIRTNIRFVRADVLQPANTGTIVFQA